MPSNTSLIMPRPPVTTRPTGKVAEAFLQAGATNTEAALAQANAARFTDLEDASSKKAIEGGYKFLRAAVFGGSHSGGGVGRPGLDKEAKARANDIMIQALTELGSLDQLEKLSKTALKRLGVKGDVSAASYADVVEKVKRMSDWDSPVRKLAGKHGLDVVDVTWEDTGRDVGSSFGRNITDFNLSVEVPDAVTGKTTSHMTPILRYPNFQDKSADLKTKDFAINVGNATGDKTTKMTLEQVLKAPWKLMSDPSKWPLKTAGGKNKGLFVDGIDAKALVSAQAAFLPVSKDGGRATYTPMAYNYSSHYSKEHGPQPATLTIMVTHEGASLAITGKKDEDKFGWNGGGYGEPLHFNADGQRAPLTAERASTAGATDPGSFEGGAANADQLNRVLIIQIPLIPEHKPARRMFAFGGGLESAMPMMAMARGLGGSDLENAVVGHGTTDGPFDETMGKGWKRDAELPVRVTVQLTKATSNGVVTEKQIKDMKKELDDVYANADRIGSLVVPDGAQPSPIVPIMPPVIPFAAE